MIAFTITILAFVVVAQRIYAGSLKDALAHMDRHCEELKAMAHEALDQRDDCMRLVAHKDEQIGWHLRAWVLVVEEDQRRLHGEDVMSAASVVREAEEWLAEEVQS